MTKACAQLTDSKGNTSYVPIVPDCDPDMTVYEDVNQILINGISSSQVEQKKLAVLSSPAVELDEPANDVNEREDDDDENQQCAPFVVINPEDVSRTFSELQNSSAGPNCSAIASNEVNFFSKKLLFFCPEKYLYYEVYEI